MEMAFVVRGDFSDLDVIFRVVFGLMDHCFAASIGHF
jgi:hypothetical protein